MLCFFLKGWRYVIIFFLLTAAFGAGQTRPAGRRLRRRPDAARWSVPSAPTRRIPLVGAYGADQMRFVISTNFY